MFTSILLIFLSFKTIIIIEYSRINELGDWKYLLALSLCCACDILFGASRIIIPSITSTTPLGVFPDFYGFYGSYYPFHSVLCLRLPQRSNKNYHSSQVISSHFTSAYCTRLQVLGILCVTIFDSTIKSAYCTRLQVLRTLVCLLHKVAGLGILCVTIFDSTIARHTGVTIFDSTIKCGLSPYLCYLVCVCSWSQQTVSVIPHQFLITTESVLFSAHLFPSVDCFIRSYQLVKTHFYKVHYFGYITSWCIQTVLVDYTNTNQISCNPIVRCMFWCLVLLATFYRLSVISTAFN